MLEQNELAVCSDSRRVEQQEDVQAQQGQHDRAADPVQAEPTSLRPFHRPVVRPAG